MSPDRSSSSMAAPRPRRPDAPWSPISIAGAACREAAHQTGSLGRRRQTARGSRRSREAWMGLAGARACEARMVASRDCRDRSPQSELYMLFSTSAYFFSTALRRTFRVGVTSPSSTLNSEGKISNRLMVSQRSRDWLASVT